MSNAVAHVCALWCPDPVTSAVSRLTIPPAGAGSRSVPAGSTARPTGDPKKRRSRTFAVLAAAISRDLAPHAAILDGEIVRPGEDGRPLFYELVRSRACGPFASYTFDLVWLDGGDLRERALVERKAALRKLVPLSPQAVRYVEHVASGTKLFRAICELDMEGIVAKQANAQYTPEATTWAKTKNRAYSQAVGRSDF